MLNASERKLISPIANGKIKQLGLADIPQGDRPEDNSAALTGETAETTVQEEVQASPSVALPSQGEESDRPIDETPGASPATAETIAASEVDDSQQRINKILMYLSRPQVQHIAIHERR